ncbi:MAG TPA: ABC transporter substrate-binding protein [Acidimicrobiales bacterium]|jgi:ABC-type branched-subunit amino acid transport system substrate-binding protein|nr:ABC transporter substrate-binding protein [Acidimicrobiales bacterium]
MGQRRRTLPALVASCVLLVTSGCGARWSDAQRDAVAGRTNGRTAAAVQPGDGTPSAATDVANDGTGTGDAAAGAAGDTAGTPGAATAGPAGGTAAPGADTGRAGTAAAGAKPCAAPSKEVGVTDKEITLGSISTLSGAVPGLGASSLAAARAYVAYRNSTGGVCGRKLVLKTADDGMDNGRYRALANDMSSQVVGLIGGVGGGDAGGADVVEAKKLPVVNTPISEVFQDVSTVFDINPPFADVHQPIAKYKYLYDQGVRKAALVYIAADQTRSEVRDKQKPQMVASGIQIVREQELPLSTLSFDSAARGVANSGADYLLFVSDPSQSASMAKSMRDTGYKLKSEEYLTAYGSKFIDLAGAAADGTTSWTRTLPNEEPNTTPEQTAFLTWMKRTAPNEVADTFAADSWSASKAMVDALEALPGAISRAALVTQLRSVQSYDAGGLLGPIKLGPKLNNGCFIAMKVVGGKWQRLAPARGFLC